MKLLWSSRGRQSPAQRWRGWVESMSMRLAVMDVATVPVRIRRELSPPWITDYDPARTQALKWLGDRYLLAKPINGNSRGESPLGMRSRQLTGS